MVLEKGEPALGTYRPSTGARSYDAAQFRGTRTYETHVLTSHHGADVLLQHGAKNDVTAEIQVPPIGHLAILIWRRGIRGMSARVGDDSFDKDHPPGVIAVVPLGTPSSWFPGEANTDNILHIHVQPKLVSDVCLRDARVVPDFAGLVGFNDPLVEQLAEQILSLIETEGKPSRLIWETSLMLIVLALARRTQHTGKRVHRGGLAGWQISRTVDLINSRLGEDVALGELAEVVGLSPFHFARAFKQAIGVPPHRYQILKRVERARELLATTDLAIQDVASLVGYEPQTLARRFRREVGVSPSTYRRSVSR